MKKAWFILCLFLLSLWGLNKGVLISEKLVKKGEFINDDYGKAEEQESLVCSYLTLTGVKDDVYWYAPNDLFGKSRCLLFQN